MTTTDPAAAQAVADTDLPSLVFDWHAEQALNRDGLLTWLVPTAMRRQDMDRLSEITDGFTQCRLTMQLNGVGLNPAAFLDGIARNVEHAVKREALRLVGDVGFDAVKDAVRVAGDAVRQEMLGRLRAAGVPIEDGDDDV